MISAAAPLVIMMSAAAVCIWLQRKKRPSTVGSIHLSSPLYLGKVFHFGLLLLVIEILGSLAQRYLGHFGFLVVSVIGGLVSSASTAGAAATLVMHRSIDMQTAGLATVLTSMTSALSNLPIVHQQIRRWTITRKVAALSCLIVGLGIVTMLVPSPR